MLFKTCVTPMIPAAILTVPRVAIIITTSNLFCFASFLKSGDGRMDTICENSDPYRA